VTVIDGIRRFLEAEYGGEALANAIGKNPTQSEEDDLVALFRDIARRYGHEMTLAEFQQAHNLPFLSSFDEYKRWASENSKASERVKQLTQENAKLKEELGRLRGNKNR